MFIFRLLQSAAFSYRLKSLGGPALAVMYVTGYDCMSSLWLDV